MKLLEALANAVTLKEASHNPYIRYDGIDSDSGDFRRLSEKSPKDLPQYKHDDALLRAYWLYMMNPIAFRITELTKDFTIGKGITFKAEDERTQEILQDHWDDPVNNWELKQHARVLELGLYGEQILRVFPNKTNGNVKIGSIDPLNIAGIKTDVENIEVAEKVVLRSQTGLEGKSFPIVRENDEGILEGEVILGQLKRVSSMTRGIPDMLSVLDWINSFDNIMFGEIERIRLMRAFTEDISIEGATPEDIQEHRKTLGTAPKWGTRWIHDEKVTREFLSPKIESADLAGFLKLVLGIVLGGAGVPEHYFALAYDINKATASEMDPPLIRRIETRQKFVGGWFKSIFNYVITQAALHNKMTGKGKIPVSELTKKNSDIWKFQIKFPDPSQKDIAHTADSIVKLTNALVIAETQEWITQDKSREVFSILAQEFGVEIKPEEQKEAIDGAQFTETTGVYAYRELKDVLDWMQSGDSELKDKVRKEVKEAFEKNGR